MQEDVEAEREGKDEQGIPAAEEGEGLGTIYWPYLQNAYLPYYAYWPY